MYIKINENNIFNYLTNNDIITIQQNIDLKILYFNFMDFVLKSTNIYLIISKNLLYIYYNEIVVIINIININDIIIYNNNIKKYYNFENDIIVNYSSEIESKYIKYKNIEHFILDNCYSITNIINNNTFHKLYISYNIKNKIIYYNNMFILYYLNYKNHNIYIRKSYYDKYQNKYKNLLYIYYISHFNKLLVIIY